MAKTWLVIVYVDFEIKLKFAWLCPLTKAEYGLV